MLVFVLNQAQKANTGKIQTPVYENVREFGFVVDTPEKSGVLRNREGVSFPDFGDFAKVRIDFLKNQSDTKICASHLGRRSGI